jgi:hypothetical protein
LFSQRDTTRYGRETALDDSLETIPCNSSLTALLSLMLEHHYIFAEAMPSRTAKAILEAHKTLIEDQLTGRGVEQEETVLIGFPSYFEIRSFRIPL